MSRLPPANRTPTVSRTPTRQIPFQGAPLPRGNFAGIENNTQAILNAIGSLVGAAAAGVTFVAEGEERELREAQDEFEIERAEALFERASAIDKADELDFKNYLAGLDNEDAAENLKRVAQLERGKLPALLATMTPEEQIALLKMYPAMAPENAERLGKTVGEELADAALVERLAAEGNALTESIRGIREAADGEAAIPNALEPVQDWIRRFIAQVEGLPDNVRNPATTRFSGRLRSMVEDVLLRGAAQDQNEAEDFAENNLRLQVQRILADDGVEANDPVDLREAIDRLAGLTGRSTESIEEQAGKLLRRGALARIDAGESAVNIQESLAGIDRRSRIWQAANTGEQGELDPLVSRAVESQQVSADDALRRNLQANAIDFERTNDVDGLQALIENELPRIETQSIRATALLDLTTRMTVSNQRIAERAQAEEAMAGHRLEAMAADHERTQSIERIQAIIDTEVPKFKDPDIRARLLLDLQTRITVIQNQLADEDIADQAATGRRLETMAADLERTREIDRIQAMIDNEVPELTDDNIRARTLLDLETRIKVIRENAARARAAQSREIAADEALSGTTDGRERGWTRETLEWMYQREIGKGQQKWEAAGRLAEHLGQVGPRVVKDIADNFTDGIANADEGLRMLRAIWEKDAALAENVLHGLSTFGRAGTKQHQGVRARVLFDLAKEHEPGSPEWNRIAELGQHPGFLPGLLEANTSLDTIEGFPVDEDAGSLKGQSLIQHEIADLMSQSSGLITPGVIDLYRSHYAAAYAREYSDTMMPTLLSTPERLARIEVARMAARDAILGRWVGIDGLMLTTQQLALTPEMARDPAVAEYIESSVSRFQGELDLLPESPSLGTPMTHGFFSPDNIWTYLPGGITDEEDPRIVAFMAIEPFSRRRRVVWQGQPEFRALLRASGITITAETVAPSGRFIWHPQYQVGTVEEFAAKFHGDTYVEEFYSNASEAWIDEGEGPPDLDNPAFVAFLDTYAKRHKWDGWLSGTTHRGEAISVFEIQLDREPSP